MRNRVLVTGGAGFIGRATVSALIDKGYEVVATCRGTPPALSDNLRWISCDLEAPADVSALIEREKPSHLVALAWYMGPGNQQAVENFEWIGHSVHLLSEFSANGGKRVVFCGSCMEYDFSQPVKLTEADTPLNAHTEYGIAKGAMAKIFDPLCGKLEISGAWARPFYLYGPGEKPQRLASSIILALLEGQEVKCTAGTQKRDFLHVDDVGSALAALLGSSLEGAVNIGSGHAVALRDLAAEIGRQIGRPELIKLGALPTRPGDPPLVEADVSRLADELGWTPEFELESGVADTISWWRHHLDQQKERTGND